MIEELIRAKPSAAKGRYLRTITLTSTMGPGVKVDPSRTRDISRGGVLGDGRRRIAPPHRPPQTLGGRACKCARRKSGTGATE